MNRTRNSFAVLLPLLFAAAAGAQTPAPLVYPESARGNQVDDYHGTAVADPYRWLEDTRSPETAAWVAAQNSVTFGYLGGIPERDAIRQRLTQVWDYPKFFVPTKVGNRLFFRENSGLLNQAILYVKDAERPARVLLDPNTLSADGTVALSAIEPSPNGRYLAYSVSASGSDWREFRVRDVNTGRDLGDDLKWIKFSGIAWTKDNRGFFYSGYGAPTEGDSLTSLNRNQKIYYHRIGTPQSADQVIYERRDQPDWLYNTRVTEDGTFAIITISAGSDPRTRIYYKYLASAGRPRLGAPVVRLIDTFEAEHEFVNNIGDYFIFRTNLGAPRGRVVNIDINAPQQDRWVTVIPETTEALGNVKAAGRHLVLSYLVDAHSTLRVYGTPDPETMFRGGRLQTSRRQPRTTDSVPAPPSDRRLLSAPGFPFIEEIDLPGLGSVGSISGRPGDNQIYYSFVSFLNPAAIYSYDLRLRSGGVFKATELAADVSQFETRQVFYTSKDGTRVPMFISMKKGTVLHGSNPTILYGYGGFGVSETPRFSPANLVWMDMGGIYAVANLRGGGEYGRDWHQAGILDRKQNVFDDFIAAAEYLIEEKYTSSPKLAISGGSNGGLLVGAVLNQRPELFGAALPAVGVMDMLRFHKFTIGWAWTSDYGSSEDPAQFQTLHAYSPLHNVRSGTSYPATLVTTADHDDRVVPGHSFKYAAALQAAQGGPAPVLIRIETSAGHGAGKPTSKQIEEAADRLAFLVRNLGMTPTLPR